MAHARWLLSIALAAALTAARPLATQTADVVTLSVDGGASATPWIAASGSLVAVAWGSTRDGRSDVYVAISHDGARSFGAPVRVNATPGDARLGGELPPRVALAPRPNREPEVVVLWTARTDTTAIRIARSTDGGRSFAGGDTLQASAAAGDRGWPALAVDSGGTAHAIWLDHRGLAARTETGAHADHKDATAHDGAAMAQMSGLYYAAAGPAAAGEREITPGVCYCCKTALTAGSHGTLYAAWRHVYPGNLRDIAFTLSRDGGRTFTAPARVSEDRWAINGCPDDGPAVAVDASGTAHIVWPTVLSGPEPQGALFYAATRDGRTFTPRQRVPTLGSPRPSHPQIAIDDGRLTIAWDELVKGQRVAVARHASSSAGGQLTFGEPIMLAPSGSAMYPVLAPAAAGMVAAWTAGAPGPSVIHVRRLR